MEITTIIYYALLVVLGYCLYQIYDFTWAKPRAFIKFFAAQGIKSRPFVFLFGQLLEIRKAAEDDTIVQVLLTMHRCADRFV